MRSLLLLAALTILCVPGCKPATTTGGAATVAKKPTRDEFRKLVMGKTKDEVAAAVGKPKRTNDDPDSWVYEDVTIDPVSGKVDSLIWVYFEQGRVSKVNN